MSLRLMEALRQSGADARMLVCEKLSGSPYVHTVATASRQKLPFIAERLEIFLQNGFNRPDLFKADTASFGLPLTDHPLVKEADVVMLNWINQGMVSLAEIKRLLESGKRVIWTMHDMWPMTGLCHHAGTCKGFLSQCGNCPLLGKLASPHDLSHRIWNRKDKLYTLPPEKIHFVAVSNWLAGKARLSSLLKHQQVSVIPNAFPIPEPVTRPERADGRFRILMGAARLDDPVKGLPELLNALKTFKKNYPDLADCSELLTFGNLRDPHALDGAAISHTHLGPVSPSKIAPLYLKSDAVVSTSLYETLPGTLVEGLVYGAVPVAFNRGGQPDIIDHLETGWLSDWDQDPQKRARSIADGLAWAAQQTDATRRRMLESAKKKFSATSVAEKYLDIMG